MSTLITNLQQIKQTAAEKETENDAFRDFIKSKNSCETDKIVHALNEAIAPQIDCTQCGNCCRSLMINVTVPEAERLAQQLDISVAAVKEQYLEESMQGQLIMNQIPCHFLDNTVCTIYENRFTECREFPHLHKNNFSSRMFGLLIHYASCPIIFNVMEALKVKTGFYKAGAPE